jgi:N-carbamoylputrescine amidase
MCFMLWREIAGFCHLCQGRGLLIVAAHVRTLEALVAMKVGVCEFPDEVSRKDAAWNALVEYVSGVEPDVVVLPEMPFCQWVFTGEAVDPGLWRQAMLLHDTMMATLGELKCGWVASSRPVEEGGRRFNEAFLWSGAGGYRAIRRKWYLPDAPTAKETVWFSRGDRNFTAVKAGVLDVGFQLCSEIMFPEHAREIGFADAHLIAHPRASGSGKRWRAACEMSAISSGCYVASANRRSYDRDWFSGGSWLFSPEAAILGETTVELPFVTGEIYPAVAEQAKTTIHAIYRECIAARSAPNSRSTTLR